MSTARASAEPLGHRLRGMLHRLAGAGPRPTPVVLQLEATECGAASLAIVLGYHGRFVPLDELRTLCGVSRDGAKASTVLRAGRTFGLEARGLKAEPSHIAGLPLPLIAFVNFNHFLVVEAVDADRVWVNDPAGGRRQETWEEFNASFTGVVLTFQPGPDFRAGDSRPDLLSSLRGRFDGLHAALGFTILVSLLLVLPGIVLPVFSRIFVDYVLIRTLDDWLLPLLIGMGITAAARMLLALVQSRALLATRTAMTLRTGRALMAHLLTLPIGFFDQRFAGEIADRLRLNEALAALLTGRLAQAAVSLVTASFFFVAMLFYHWPIALGVLVLALANVAVLLLSHRLISEQYRKVSLDQGKLMGARVAGLKDMETFKASGSEDMLFTRWFGLHVAVVNGLQRIAALSAWISPVPALLGSLIGILVLFAGGYAVMRGDLTLGGLVALQTLAASFAAPVSALAGFGAELQQIRSYTARLDDVSSQQPDARFRSEASLHVVRDDRSAPLLPSGRLSMRGVSFGYGPLDPPLLEHIDIDLTPGRRIALVGASGSGKSTLGKLIVGLEHPRTGEYSLDDRPFADWPRAAVAQRLAYVPQQVTLFEGSVHENLSLWDATLPDTAITRAATDARIHPVIAARPGSYDAAIAEGGRNFSGGERQRMEIARALATDPAIVVLDEATSALDPVTELEVFEALRRRGVGCVIIAHRLSAIRDCDEIIVLDRGHIVERGTHRELVAQGGAYVRLLEA